MNLLKSIKQHPVMHGVAGVVIAVAAFAASSFAWGPTDRATFTVNSPAPYITFDSITDNPNYGDERNFSIVKDAASTNAADWRDTLAVQDGKEYLVRIYVHNNASANLNLVAKNTRASVNLPTTTGKSIEINSFISADNANPSKIWDQVTLTSDKDFNLAYVAGSAKYTNNLFPQGTPLSDSLFTNSGALLGYDKLDGNIPGCFQYSGYVTFRVKPQFASAAFTMSKQVRKHSTTTGGWVENYTAQPGEKVDFVVSYNNTGTTTMNNVVIKDALPAGYTYVAGSSILANGTNPTGAAASDNIVTSNGMNIGNYAPGATAWVRFSATVAKNSDLKVCGNNTLTNVATVETDFGHKSDTAAVTVNKTCSTPTTTDNNVTVCNVKTGVIETIKESVYNANKQQYADKNSDRCKVIVCEISSKTVKTISIEQQKAHPELYEAKDSATCVATTTTAAELPHTGFGLNIMSLIGLGALSYTGYAYAASRRGL